LKDLSLALARVGVLLLRFTGRLALMFFAAMAFFAA
jgi:hypothetical protein